MRPASVDAGRFFIMAEHLTIHSGNKAERYATLLPQLSAIFEGETDAIANMANLTACLWETLAGWTKSRMKPL